MVRHMPPERSVSHLRECLFRVGVVVAAFPLALSIYLFHPGSLDVRVTVTGGVLERLTEGTVEGVELHFLL